MKSSKVVHRRLSAPFSTSSSTPLQQQSSDAKASPTLSNGSTSKMDTNSVPFIGLGVRSEVLLGGRVVEIDPKYRWLAFKALFKATLINIAVAIVFVLVCKYYYHLNTIREFKAAVQAWLVDPVKQNIHRNDIFPEKIAQIVEKRESDLAKDQATEEHMKDRTEKLNKLKSAFENLGKSK